MKIIDCRNSDSVRGKNGEFDKEVCDRHVLVFGTEMQARISRSTIGIGSVGGLGSILLELLARLYPGKLMVVDNDVVEKSNLNRLTGSRPVDAILSVPKVHLAARTASEINPTQEIEFFHGDFLDEATQRRFRECDYFFSCFDRPGPRLAANTLCLAHGIELFDIGTGAVVENSRLTAAGGQIARIRPDSGFCLSCSGMHDGKELKADLMADSERVRQSALGYVRGAEIRSPQVYALNMMAASWAVWLFMRIVAGEAIDFDGIAIDALNFEAYTWCQQVKKPNNCPICGPGGVVFGGDKVDLLVKSSESGCVNLETLESMEERLPEKEDDNGQVRPDPTETE